MNGEELLKRNWTTEQREILERLIENLNACKYLIPSSLKKDIIAAIHLCIQLKDSYDKSEFEEEKTKVEGTKSI